MAGPELVVDGYNVLLALARREGVRDPGPRLAAMRGTLHDLLARWAEARQRPVTVVWDGHGSAPAAPPEGLRIVFVEPPAEADDWIARHAAQAVREGRPVAVVTRDLGLRRRMPAGAETHPLDALAHDLEALAHGPLRAPGVGRGTDAPVPVPAGTDAVDLARLPRRRVRRERDDEAPLPPPAPRPAAAGPAAAPRRPAGKVADGEAARREAARQRREARRRRFQRAQSRKKKR